MNWSLPRHADSPSRRPLRDGVAIVGLVVLLHAALLQMPPYPSFGAASTPTLSVRLLPQAFSVRNDGTPASPRPVADSLNSPPRAPMSVPASDPTAYAEPGTVTAALPKNEASALSAPTFATRVAASTTLSYRLTRGSRQGEAQLRWEVQQPSQGGGDRYELSLHLALAGQDSTGWASQGQFDAAGLAPVRFVDRRRGRDRSAVNFDRQRRELSFSGPSDRYPLMLGTQDRLSWMIQVPAIVDADPARFTAGRHIPLWVAGVRGEVDLWLFDVQGPEAAPAGLKADQGVLHLVREPLRPYDHRIEVWLDPARHHLPVRVLFTPVPTGESTDMTLSP